MLGGGVDSHASSGPIPVSVCGFNPDIQSSQNRWKQFAEGRWIPTTARLLLQHVCHDFRFVVARIVRSLFDGRFQVGLQNIQRRLMSLVELPQFLQDRVRLAEA